MSLACQGLLKSLLFSKIEANTPLIINTEVNVAVEQGLGTVYNTSWHFTIVRQPTTMQRETNQAVNPTLVQMELEYNTLYVQMADVYKTCTSLPKSLEGEICSVMHDLMMS